MTVDPQWNFIEHQKWSCAWVCSKWRKKELWSGSGSGSGTARDRFGSAVESSSVSVADFVEVSSVLRILYTPTSASHEIMTYDRVKKTSMWKQYPQTTVETRRIFVEVSLLLKILFMSTSTSQEFTMFDYITKYPRGETRPAKDCRDRRDFVEVSSVLKILFTPTSNSQEFTTFDYFQNYPRRQAISTKDCRDTTGFCKDLLSPHDSVHVDFDFAGIRYFWLK